MSKNAIVSFESLENRLSLSADPLFSNQWALASISAEKAWNSANSSNKPIVAIVDSGMDLNHEDLKANLWVNTKEIANDNIDNDGNGYVDDINGWNFAGVNNKPQDNYYHGTMVAGIIGAVKDNNLGIGGIAPDVRILPIKFQSDSGVGYAGGAAAGIDYATALKMRGENIAAINISWTSGMSDNINIRNAIQRASDNGIVVVIAAGNDGVDLGASPRYPASYHIANTIVVGSINPDNSLSGFSNYNKDVVDIAAPGAGIESTLPNNSYGSGSGTSFSAPQVSGVVAFLKSINLYYSASQIKQAILSGADYISGLVDKVRVGILDMKGAVDKLLGMKPELSAVTPPVQQVPVAPVTPPAFGVINYHLDIVSKSLISGWANDSLNNSVKLIVEVRINNVLRYSLVANSYRSDTHKYNGFSVSVNRNYLRGGLNLVTVVLKNPVTNSTKLVYSGNIRK